MTMNHIQGMANYKAGKLAVEILVVVVAHSRNGQSTILLPDGQQKRVATSNLTMVE
jgi:hypothetical protein